MADVKTRAAEARRLLADPVFKDVTQGILDNASKLFLNATSSISVITDAHERVRMVQLFIDELNSRVNAEAVIDKRNRKGQHRNVD